MDVCRDYEDLFKSLNAHNIKYLVVGAEAVIYYTEPRYTKDIDVLIPHDLNDPEKIYQALKEFGIPLIDITPQDFLNKKFILQIGVSPVRIDILVSLQGLKNSLAWKNRKRTRYGKTPIYVLGLSDLFRVKKTAGRPQDLLDADKLMEWYGKKLSIKKPKRH